MASTVDIYYMPPSAPSRAVLMGAKNIGVTVNHKITNLFAGEHKTPAYSKMNPQQTIPTMDDNGFYLYESRAILQYLANAYGKNDNLYPKDPKKRAIVDQRLQFDQGTLYKTFTDAYYGVIHRKQPKMDPITMAAFNSALEVLSGYLSKTAFVAADTMTIADFSVMASLSTAESCEHDFSKHPLVLKYMQRCKGEIKGYEEANQVGATQFGAYAKPFLDKARA